jgi:hypothetical protein
MRNSIKWSLPAILKSSTPVILAGLELAAERNPEVARNVPKKYLVNWSLSLDPGDLGMISKRPEVLHEALDYVRGLSKENGFEIYRIVPMEELTRRVRPTAISASASLTGIAIVAASSLEEVTQKIGKWVAGLSYGPPPYQTTLGDRIEYEVKPLADIGWSRRE